MKRVKCSICNGEFLTSQDSRPDEFQMVNCLHCGSILFWKAQDGTIAKTIEQYNTLRQFEIYFTISEAF